MEAVQGCEKLAYEYGNQEIEQEHLLYSLLIIEDSLILKLVEKMEIQKEHFTNRCEQALNKRVKVQGGQVYVGKDLNKVLISAEDEAKQMGDEYVSVEHLFLSMLKAPNKEIKEIFREYGITRERFLQALSTVRGNQRVTGDNPEATYDTLNKYGEDKKSTNEYVGKSTYDQTMMFSAQFDYVNTFAKDHNVSATLLGWGYQTQASADSDHGSNLYHRTSNVNLGLHAAYNYAHKYYADFSGAYVHSAKLAEGNRGAFSPSLSLGWRISNEDFFRNNVNFVDDLKITASYAKLHQDLDISDFYLYKGYFIDDFGWYQWRDGVGGGWTTGSKRGDNADLDFITREEFRVGIDATLFNKLLKVNANYFVQSTNGLLTPLPFFAIMILSEDMGSTTIFSR